MTGEQLLEHAATIVAERRATYGEPEQLFEHIAKRWSLVLDIEVTPAQVALCLIEREAFEEAEPLLLRALKICESIYPETHPQMGYMLTRIQNLYRYWGRDDEAERWLERLEAARGG